MWKLVKCNCEHASCDKYSISHPSFDGCFYQGCGWPKDQAQAIIDRLNDSPRLTPKQKSALREAVFQARGWYGNITGDSTRERQFIRFIDNAVSALERLGIKPKRGTRIE